MTSSTQAASHGAFDQGSQFFGHDWQDFLRDHNVIASMSRRGNCHDNAVAESSFQFHRLAAKSLKGGVVLTRTVSAPS